MSIFDDTEDEDVIQHLLNNVEDKDIPALLQAWYDIFMEICWLGDYDKNNIIKLLIIYSRNFYLEKNIYKPEEVTYIFNKYDGDIHDRAIVIDEWVKDFSKGYRITTPIAFQTFIVGALRLSWPTLTLFEKGIYKKSYIIKENDNEIISIQSKYNEYFNYIKRVLKIKGVTV